MRRLDAGFVFLYGHPTVGKSMILSSLLHCATVEGYGSVGLSFMKDSQLVPADDDADATAVLQKLRHESDVTWDALQQVLKWDARHRTSTGFLPARTDSGRPPLQLAGRAIPHKRGLPARNIVLLEMAGEDLKRYAARDGALPSSIDVYLRATGLKMIFLLVVPWSQAAREDVAVARFMDHVAATNPRLRNTRFVLLLTKWDTNPKRASQSGVDLAREEMPQTWQRLRPKGTDIVSEFSVGRVELRETSERAENGDWVKAPYLVEFDPTYPVELWRTIYQSFTNRHLQSWLQRRFSDKRRLAD